MCKGKNRFYYLLPISEWRLAPYQEAGLHHTQWLFRRINTLNNKCPPSLLVFLSFCIWAGITGYEISLWSVGQLSWLCSLSRFCPPLPSWWGEDDGVTVLMLCQGCSAAAKTLVSYGHLYSCQCTALGAAWGKWTPSLLDPITNEWFLLYLLPPSDFLPPAKYDSCWQYEFYITRVEGHSDFTVIILNSILISSPSLVHFANYTGLGVKPHLKQDTYALQLHY